MLKTIARYLFGSLNDRRLKIYQEKVVIINSLEAKISALSDQELQQQTPKLKERLAKGEKLNDLLPEAFATVRETAKRVIGQRPYDVQLIGGMALHDGMIAEMGTGEGKTLAAPLAAYLNSLSGQGVHIVTVNDYLARRDANWMGKIYQFLGLSVGCIVHDLDEDERRAAYNCDITYGTNNELGFDYLRDNMRYSLEEMVHRKFNFAIIDEVDSILIDEARTPLIISGPTEDNSVLYLQINQLIPKLVDGDYEKDEKTRTVTLTEQGTDKIEQLLLEKGIISANSTLYDIENVNIVHHVNQALRAHKLFSKDTDYMIANNQLLIIDEFTGRALEGRRYSEGLHQALEAKEGLPIQNENQTLASITFQNYFRLYPKLSGMTGTAMTEANEFSDIYKLEVVGVPPNLTLIRVDEDDEIYRTAEEKYNAIVKVIEERHQAQQPILVGTISIEKSEYIANLLKKKNIPYSVLNAKYHEKEASIIAQAGKPGVVTIATNMAGRGTDIMLGGNPEMLISELADDLSDAQRAKQIEQIEAKVAQDKTTVLAAGGLYVIGSERHESRRIDNQLRGRSGRQGDPGRTKFFLSLEDDLMRIFASDRISSILAKLGLEKGEAIFHPMISRALEKAQAKVEARNYDIRKNLLRYDDVANDQRKIIYEQRIEIMETADVSYLLKNMYNELNQKLVDMFTPENTYPETWDIESFGREIFRIYGREYPLANWRDQEGIDHRKMFTLLNQEVEQLFVVKEQKFGEKLMRLSEQRILLITLDQLWKDHLLSLDHLRQGINLRAYGQKDPLNEYKREAFMAFDAMMENLRELYVTRIAHMEISHDEDEEEKRLNQLRPRSRTFESRIDPALGEQEYNGGMQVRLRNAEENWDPNDPNSWGRVGRNEPCPCGSTKKFKHCHGAIQ